MVHGVSDGESDLGAAGRPVHLVAGYPDGGAAEPGDERHVAWLGGAADALRLPLRVHRTQAEEAQVQVVGRHGRVQFAHGVGILGPGRPDPHGAAVGEQCVPAGRGSWLGGGAGSADWQWL